LNKSIFDRISFIVLKNQNYFNPKSFCLICSIVAHKEGKEKGRWRGDGGLGAHQYPLKNFFIKMQYNLQDPPSFFATQSTPSFAKNPQ
jgi:hypothetical protein